MIRSRSDSPQMPDLRGGVTVTALQLTTLTDEDGHVIYRDVREDGPPLEFYDFDEAEGAERHELGAWIDHIPATGDVLRWDDLPETVQQEFVIAFWTPHQSSLRNRFAHALSIVGIWGPLRRLSSTELPPTPTPSTF